MSRAVALALLWLLAGCDAVTLPEPLGGTPVDAAALQGAWLAETPEPQTLHVRQPEPGRLLLAWVDWRQERFVLDTGEALARRDGEQHYFSMRDPDQPDSGFLFVRYRQPAADRLELWPPQVEAFRQAVEQGQLAGRVLADRYSTRVLLTGPAEDLARFLGDAGSGQVWQTEPVRLRRLSGP